MSQKRDLHSPPLSGMSSHTQEITYKREGDCRLRNRLVLKGKKSSSDSFFLTLKINFRGKYGVR